jgi:hypothetical protein
LAGAGKRLYLPLAAPASGSTCSDCDTPGKAWLEVIHDRGFEAVQRVCLNVLEGRVDPKTANVLSLD